MKERERPSVMLLENTALSLQQMLPFVVQLAAPQNGIEDIQLDNGQWTLYFKQNNLTVQTVINLAQLPFVDVSTLFVTDWVVAGQLVGNSGQTALRFLLHRLISKQTTLPAQHTQLIYQHLTMNAKPSPFTCRGRPNQGLMERLISEDASPQNLYTAPGLHDNVNNHLSSALLGTSANFAVKWSIS